jgi:PAS domain S-box-containing protein
MPRELLEKTTKELSLLQFALDHVSDCVHWMDAQGRILYVNQASCRSLERSREQLLSLSIPDIAPLFPQERWNSFWKELKARGSMIFETQHRTPQGRDFPVEITELHELRWEGVFFLLCA